MIRDAGVPERIVVPVDGGRPSPDRRLDDRLQSNRRHTSLNGLTPEAFAAQLNPARMIA